MVFLGSPHQFISLADFLYPIWDKRVPVCYFRVMAVQRRILHIVRSNNGQSRSIKVHRYAELYPNVYLMGHSMGGLLAINESICSKANVKGLILLNTAIKIGLKSRSSLYSTKNFFSRNQFIIALTAITEKNNSVTVDNILYTVGWLPRVVDLTRLSRLAVKNLPKVTVPVLITQSRNDEAVLWRSAETIEKGLINCPYHRLVYLQRSWHSYYFKKEQKADSG